MKLLSLNKFQQDMFDMPLFFLMNKFLQYKLYNWIVQFDFDKYLQHMLYILHHYHYQHIRQGRHDT